VTVFLTEVCDVGPACFEDPQPEETKHGDQGEVVGLAEPRAAASMASN
jgi:hypothetical protein